MLNGNHFCRIEAVYFYHTSQYFLESSAVQCVHSTSRLKSLSPKAPKQPNTQKSQSCIFRYQHKFLYSCRGSLYTVTNELEEMILSTNNIKYDVACIKTVSKIKINCSFKSNMTRCFYLFLLIFMSLVIILFYN